MSAAAVATPWIPATAAASHPHKPCLLESRETQSIEPEKETKLDKNLKNEAKLTFLKPIYVPQFPNWWLYDASVMSFDDSDGGVACFTVGDCVMFLCNKAFWTALLLKCKLGAYILFIMAFSFPSWPVESCSMQVLQT